MIFDGALTDPKIRSDVLARMTGENQSHDLVFAGGQALETLLRRMLQPEHHEDEFLLLSENRAFCTFRCVADPVQDGCVRSASKASSRV